MSAKALPMRFAVGDKVWHRPTRACGIIVEVKPEDDSVILEQGVDWLKCDDLDLVVSGGNQPAVRRNIAAEQHPSLGDAALLDPKLRTEQMRSDLARKGYLVADEVEVGGRVETVVEVDEVQALVRLRGDKDGVWRSWDELMLRNRPSLGAKDVAPEVANLTSKGKADK